MLQEGEIEPISNSESPPVRLACREWEGVASGPSHLTREEWAERVVSAAEPDAGGAAAVAALGMGGAPAACAGGRRRRCRSPSGHLYSGASLLPRAVVCWGKR